MQPLKVPQALMEETVSKADQVQALPGQSLIEAAVSAGVLSAEEAHELQQAEAARRVVIDVDDFAKEELTLEAGKVR